MNSMPWMAKKEVENSVEEKLDKIPFPFYQPKNKAIITRHDDRYFSLRTLESKSQPTRFVYPLERDEERLDSSRGGDLARKLRY